MPLKLKTKKGKLTILHSFQEWCKSHKKVSCPDKTSAAFSYWHKSSWDCGIMCMNTFKNNRLTSVMVFSAWVKKLYIYRNSKVYQESVFQWSFLMKKIRCFVHSSWKPHNHNPSAICHNFFLWECLNVNFYRTYERHN